MLSPCQIVSLRSADSRLRTATSSLAAVLRGSQRGPHAMLNYFVFVVGALACLFSRYFYVRLGGAILVCLSIAFFVAHRAAASMIMWNHGTHEHVDLNGISKHYKISQGSNGAPILLGPDGFWVAELVEEGQAEGQIVGCVGLGE